MNKTQQDLSLGQKINVHTLPGREGKPIGRLPDGRVILFDQDSPYYAALAPGQSVEGHVIVVSESYVIVSPACEPERVEDEPIPETYMDDIIEELEKLTGEGFGEIVGELENMVGRVPKNAKTITRALIHVIQLEQLIIKILTRENQPQ